MHMEDMKIFLTLEKEQEMLTERYRNEAWDGEMLKSDNEKRKRETAEGIELTNQESIRTLGEKENNTNQWILNKLIWKKK